MGVLKKLFASKKAIIAIVGLLLEGVAATGVLKLDEGIRQVFMENVAILCGAYFIGQGAADWGKGAKEKE